MGHKRCCDNKIMYDAYCRDALQVQFRSLQLLKFNVDGTSSIHFARNLSNDPLSDYNS